MPPTQGLTSFPCSTRISGRTDSLFLFFFFARPKKRSKKKGRLRRWKKILSIPRASWRNDVIRFAHVVLRRCLAMENGFFPLRRRLVKSQPSTTQTSTATSFPNTPSTQRNLTRKPACTTTKQGTINHRCSQAGMRCLRSTSG